MPTLFSSTTKLVGAAPWAVGSFTLESGQSFSITAFGLGADDMVCIEQVHNVQLGSANVTLDGCGINLPDGEVVAKSQQLVDCGVKVCICAKQPWVRLDSGRFPPGDYRLSVSGTNIANGTVVINSEISEAFGSGSCAYCAACDPVVIAPPPVTQVITPCPIVFPAQWDGMVYANSALFSAAVVTAGYAYAAATCTITAPAGTVLPPAPVTVAAVPFSGLPSPITFPVVFEGATYTNLAALDAAIEAAYGVAVTTTTSGVLQTAGAVGSLPASVPVSAPVSVVVAGGAGQPACPLNFPVTYNGFAYNTLATLKTSIEFDQDVATSYNATTCTFTQTGGGGVLTNPNITVATIIPVTGLACPLVFPLVWNQDGATYATQGALKTAIEAFYGITTSYNAATCTFTVLTGDVIPAPVATVSAVPALPVSTLSACPPAYPVLFNGAIVASFAALKTAIEAFYSVVTTYNATTCVFTQVGGAGSMPPVIQIENSCGFYLAGGAVTNNGVVNQFRKVTADAMLLPLAGFTEFNDNSGALISLLRLTSGTQCGITFNVPVADNSGVVIGYGAQI